MKKLFLLSLFCLVNAHLQASRDDLLPIILQQARLDPHSDDLQSIDEALHYYKADFKNSILKSVKTGFATLIAVGACDEYLGSQYYIPQIILFSGTAYTLFYAAGTGTGYLGARTCLLQRKRELLRSQHNSQ